jgi:hypothetical protein
LTLDPLPPVAGQNHGLGGDAFVGVISTTLSGRGAGDILTYLGGSQLDQGTGIAVDIFGATYVAGSTQSIDFPISTNPFQGTQNSGSQDAFVTQIGAFSQLSLTVPTTSPSPNPVNAGTSVAFTFDIANIGPDNASFVTFNAIVPATGLASLPTAKVSAGTGSCGAVSGNVIQCTIPSLTVCTTNPCTTQAAVEVDMTPAVNTGNSTLSVSGTLSANNGPVQQKASQSVNVTDFTMSSSPAQQTINAGDTALIQVSFKPLSNLGYSATITPTQTSAGPGGSIVTASTPVFNPTSVTLSGSGTVTTALSIATVARPVTTGSLLRHGSFYATWLPIGGLSLVGLGIGAGRRRRRWLAGIVLGVIAGAMLLQSGCGSSSSSTNPTGGTLAGRYTITINGSAGTSASHSTTAILFVN